MVAEGNIRKMKSTLAEEVNYALPLRNVLEPSEEIPLNALIGHQVKIRFTGDIHCVVTGKKIKKTFGEGMSYEAFMNSPQASPSIIRPELSRIHEGVALRDEEWEIKHHLQPHYTYLSLTSAVKVGVTRSVQIPTRWIDQGAVQGIILAETPYRQLAGLIEVTLKDYVTDKTNWRKMLKNEYDHSISLLDRKNDLLDVLPEEFHEFIYDDDSITTIQYPVSKYPEKVNSLKLEREKEIEGTLVGIKGQYLIFDKGVMNVRSHSGYRIQFEY